MRVRVLSGVIGLCGVAVGAILAAAGPAGLAVGGKVLLGHAGFVLLGIAVAVLLYNIAPAGALAGPVVLGVVAGTVLAWQRGWWSGQGIWVLAGLALLFTGGALVLRKGSEAVSPDPVRRVVAALIRRRVSFGPAESAPERLRLIAIAARLDVDLHLAPSPVYGPMEVFVSCWGGTISLDLPANWAVVAGRVTAARSIRFKGVLDSPDTFPDPDSTETEVQLAQIVQERQGATGTEGTGVAVVVHVLGVAGSVGVVRH